MNGGEIGRVLAHGGWPPRCSVPGCNGISARSIDKEALWDRFYTAAPATMHAIRAALQRSQASIAALAQRFALNPKTVHKWKRRDFVHDAPMGPKTPRSTVLTPQEEALCVAKRQTHAVTDR